jgi:rubredoxin
MNDAPGDIPNDPPLWPDKQFDRIAKHAACPVCEIDSWWVFDSPSITSTVALLGPSRIMTFTRACTNCGYVQQFVRDVLLGTLRPPDGAA